MAGAVAGDLKTIVVDEAAARRMARAVVAELRSLEVRPGDRVATLAGTGVEFIAGRDAITAAGGVMVPVNPKLTAPEVAYVLAHAGARVVFAEPGLADVARAAAPEGTAVRELGAMQRGEDEDGVDPRAIGATLIYTSGTTGRPKGCWRSEAQETARAEEIIATYGLGADDVHLIACPLAHSAPGIFLRAGRRVGAQTVLLPKFRPREFLAAAEAHRATFFFLVPTQYERLLELPEAERRACDLSSVRAAIVAGAPIAIDTKQRIIEWLGPVLWEFYGSSETGTIAVLRPEEQLARPGSVGRPAPGVRLELAREDGAEARVGDVGEIYVTSPAVMSGYFDPETERVEAARADPRGVSVGDLGRVDEDGYLYLVDRKHDTIITGGVNVYPAEVERALAEHPDVYAAVVAGLRDPAWGQRVAALVAARSNVSADALREFLRERLAPFKIPKQIELVDPGDVPIGSSGKPLRREAARRLSES